MRVIGIDPGLTRTGWAVIEEKGGGLHAVDHGTIAAGVGGPAETLAAIRSRLLAAIGEHEPGAMAVERIFFNRNVRTAVRAVQASGIALCVAAEQRLPVFEYGPLEVKRAVVGVGDATKSQVEFMVRRIVKMERAPDSPDAADAVALAITLLHSRPWVVRAAR